MKITLIRQQEHWMKRWLWAIFSFIRSTTHKENCWTWNQLRVVDDIFIKLCPLPQESEKGSFGDFLSFPPFPPSPPPPPLCHVERRISFQRHLCSNMESQDCRINNFHEFLWSSIIVTIQARYIYHKFWPLQAITSFFCPHIL